MVDPAGLKPAPHDLKGRCSVTRAPGQKIGCGGRTRTFDIRINNAAPYRLGYATRNWTINRVQKLVAFAMTRLSHLREVAAAARVELASTRLQVERSGFPIELRRNYWWTGRDSNPHKKFAGPLCTKTRNAGGVNVRTPKALTNASPGLERSHTLGKVSKRANAESVGSDLEAVLPTLSAFGRAFLLLLRV